MTHHDWRQNTYPTCKVRRIKSDFSSYLQSSRLQMKSTAACCPDPATQKPNKFWGQARNLQLVPCGWPLWDRIRNKTESSRVWGACRPLSCGHRGMSSGYRAVITASRLVFSWNSWEKLTLLIWSSSKVIREKADSLTVHLLHFWM